MRAGISLYLLTLTISSIASAQQPASLEKTVSAILVRMASPDLTTRETAFAEVLALVGEGYKGTDEIDYRTALPAFFGKNQELAERVKLGLIGLLKADNEEFFGAPQRALTETDSEHYAQVIDIVSRLDDERAIPSLVDAISTGMMATTGILKFGEQALEPVLAQLNNRSPEIRSSAVGVAISILQTKNDDVSRDRIIALIRAAIGDPEFLVRSSALRAIEKLDDWQPFLPALQEMAEHDPFIVPGKSGYPLRVRAKKLLDKSAK